jgi:hypothetical protein
LNKAYVHGLGLWTPGYTSPVSWCAGDPDPAALHPCAELLTGPLRRRAPALTRMCVEVLHQAITQAGFDPSTIRTVFGTAHGEHTTALRLLDMMQRGSGKVSPIHFHHSVHNTPGGYASIATGNRSPSTTLSGGGELVATTLLEGLCIVQAGATDVVVVLGDEPLLPPFDPPEPMAPLALAFGLSSRRDGAQALLTGLQRDSVTPLKRHERFGNLHVSAALPLLERIVLARPGCVPLEFDGGIDEKIWRIEVDLLEPPVFIHRSTR